MIAVIAIIQGHGVMIKLILKVFANEMISFFFVCSLSLKIHVHFCTPGNGDLKLN